MDFLPAAKHTLQAMTIVGLMVGCATETNNPVVPPPGGVGAHRPGWFGQGPDRRAPGYHPGCDAARDGRL